MDMIILLLLSNRENRKFLYLEKIKRKTNKEINKKPNMPLSCNTSR